MNTNSVNTVSLRAGAIFQTVVDCGTGDARLNKEKIIENEIGFSAAGVLEKGTEFSSKPNGEIQVLDCDIEGVIWIENCDSYDVFELPCGAKVFVKYVEP